MIGASLCENYQTILKLSKIRVFSVSLRLVSREILNLLLNINGLDAYYGILRKDLQYILRNRPIIDFS